jgi:hypothetical protein
VITEYHVEKIRQMSALEVTQGVIAAHLGISPKSVGRVQARFAIAHLSRTEGRRARLAQRDAGRGEASR